MLSSLPNVRTNAGIKSKLMKKLTFDLVFVATLIAALSSTAQATPRIPDAGATAGLCALAFAGLAVVRKWMR